MCLTVVAQLDDGNVDRLARGDARQNVETLGVHDGVADGLGGADPAHLGGRDGGAVVRVGDAAERRRGEVFEGVGGGGGAVVGAGGGFGAGMERHRGAGGGRRLEGDVADQADESGDLLVVVVLVVLLVLLALGLRLVLVRGVVLVGVLALIAVRRPVLVVLVVIDVVLVLFAVIVVALGLVAPGVLDDERPPRNHAPRLGRARRGGSVVGRAHEARRGRGPAVGGRLVRLAHARGGERGRADCAGHGEGV
jgi:hypothetical protein